mmetsp:Transcript_13037/g.24921  ORF Transcript_13037/g.24921 Transcript_13037/m.24921 type:complete len:261 (+) Transcript_13037:1588-2370(+)
MLRVAPAASLFLQVLLGLGFVHLRYLQTGLHPRRLHGLLPQSVLGCGCGSGSSQRLVVLGQRVAAGLVRRLHRRRALLPHGVARHALLPKLPLGLVQLCSELNRLRLRHLRRAMPLLSLGLRLENGVQQAAVLLPELARHLLLLRQLVAQLLPRCRLARQLELQVVRAIGQLARHAGLRRGQVFELLGRRLARCRRLRQLVQLALHLLQTRAHRLALVHLNGGLLLQLDSPCSLARQLPRRLLRFDLRCFCHLVVGVPLG